MHIYQRPYFVLVFGVISFSLLFLYSRWSNLQQPAAVCLYSDEQRNASDRNPSLLFDNGIPKAPGENYTRTLVIGRRKEDDVSWVARELPSLRAVVYVVDDPSSLYHVPKNKGREAMVYLTYIIDHYDNLTDTTLFFHHHQFAWHNNVLLGTDAATTIRRLSDDRVARMGYFNTRCHMDPGCPDWIHLDRPEVDFDEHAKPEEKHFTKKIWHELHPFARIPPALSQPCCAQFALSRDRIRLVPKSQYIHYRNWLLTTPLDDESSGRVMEYTWQYIFTQNAELCPRMSTCYCDGYGICFGGAVKLKAWLDKLLEKEKADEELRRWEEAGDDPQRKSGLTETLEYWKDRAHRLGSELDAEKAEAYARGDDPKNRVLEAGRGD